MKKEKLAQVLLILFLLLIPLISSIDTKVKVTTYSNHRLSIDFLNSQSGKVQLFKAFNLDSGDSGVVEFIFTSNESKFDINAFALQGTETKAHQRFNGLTAGEPLHLILLAGGEKIIKNYIENETTGNSENTTIENQSIIEETILNETETNLTEENASVSPGITGLATSSDDIKDFFSKNLKYFGIGLLALVVIFFIVTKFLKKGDGLKPDIKVRKLSEIKKETVETGDYKKSIEQAEKKIEEAQREIRRIKNTEKIEEIKKRIIDDEKELMKLRR